MPARYEIDAGRRLVISTATGTLTDEDLLAQLDALVADPDFDPHFRQIADFREVTRLEVTSAGVRRMRDRTPWTRPTRRALVCPGDEVYGMARMYQILTDDQPPTVRVFRTLPEALAWLDSEERP